MAAPACAFTVTGEHRCGIEHHDLTVREGYVHVCGCGYRWTCLTGSIGELFDMIDAAFGKAI